MNSTYKYIFLNLIISIGLTGSISTSWAEEPQTSAPEMTVIKEYSARATINGDFEASRRQWLASLRSKRSETGLDDDKLSSEEETERAGFSKDFLQKMIEKIRTENTPQK